MTEIPNELRYTKDHEWVREQDDGILAIGITDHAQAALGDLVFVELPVVEDVIGSGAVCAVAESVKAASDVYSPLAGTITEANTALADAPELVNSDPYGEGWLFRLRPDLPAEIEELLDNEDYARLLTEFDD